VRHAVHAGVVIVFLHERFIHVPIALLATGGARFSRPPVNLNNLPNP
jgi:hypothetical protein